MKVEQKTSGSGWISVIKLGMVCLTAIILGVLAYLKIGDLEKSAKVQTEKITKDVLDTVKDIANRVFGGEVKIRVDADSTPGKEIMMYSLYENEIQVEYVYSTTWGGSTKELKLNEKYEVRYGIDASFDGWQATDVGKGVIKLDNICPKVISCRRMGCLKVEEKEGFWNKIQPAERENAHKGLDATAESKANANNEAFERVREKVIELLNGGKDRDEPVFRL